MRKKNLYFILLVLAVCAVLAGCFNSAGPLSEDQSSPAPSGAPYITTDPTAMVTPNPSPDAMGQATPNQNGQNTQRNGQQNAQATPYDWAGQASAVETRINMFSEIQDCRVVVDDETALVGVRFTGQYQGELTQRIRDMIAGEVMAADNRIQVVAVTAQEEDVNQIYQLADQQRSGADDDQIEDDIEKIVRNATTLR